MREDIKRVTRNTFLLYIRMFLYIIIGLFTARVVLDTLGVINYGVYGIVGSVTGALAFLNSTLSGSTSRFISFELGKKNPANVRKTMSSALQIHFALALLILILGETVGIWFLNNKLVIPPERLFAAKVVYQFSLFGGILDVMRTPYNADIIANEKMDVYAYFEIANVLMKLAIVYLLVIGNFDKLILYAFLSFCVSIIVFFLYKIYCNRNFQESRFSFQYNKEYIKQQLSFSGYNLFGNMGVTVNTLSTNFLINIFFGVIYNAAVGIANTISNTINGFVANINTAFRPALIKAYAANDFNKVAEYLHLATVASIYLLALIGIPLVLNINYILVLWLKIVPPDTNIFATLIILDIIFVNTRYIFTMGIHAVGKIRENSIINGSMYIINPLIIYVLFKIGLPVYFAFSTIILVDILLCGTSVIILRKLMPEISLSIIIKNFLKSLIIIAFSVLLMKWAIGTLDIHKFAILVLSVLANSIFISFAFYRFIIDSELRKNIRQFISAKYYLLKNGCSGK